MINSRLQVMDLTSLKAVIKDLRNKIIPSRFEKAQQPDPNSLQLGLRTFKGLTWIELCWTGEAARLVEINPPAKIGSRSTLAKQIQYGLKDLALISINQKGFERIIQFELAIRPGDPIEKILILELMGRHSNIFLLDKNQKVITLGRQVRTHQSRLRPISTGDIYLPPPPLQGIPPSKKESFERWKKRLSLLPINLKQSLQETYQGISPSLALQLVNENKEIAQEILSIDTQKLSLEIWKDIYRRWCLWLTEIESKNSSLYFKGPTDFMNWSTSNVKDSEINISLKLGNYYNEKITLKKINLISKNLSNKIMKLNKDESKELSKQLELLSKTKEEKMIKQKADEILCQASLSKEEIEKSQKLYRKSKKLRRSASLIEERINYHKQRILNIEESLDFLSNILSSKSENKIEKLDRIIELQSELEEHLIKSKKANKNNKDKKKISSQHLEVKSNNGVIIQIGRNHRQNEFISIKSAKKGDIWFHAQECPGSHVVLKASLSTINDEDIQISADFAALFSRSKGNKKTPIIMTKIEHLQRIQGALPGTVRHRHSKVIWGESDRAMKHMTTETSRNDLSS
tara:strand:- start:1577 stop:3301 length:1725 start_codon:yes stop_codon:yes gene_type:complete